jgi:hypothetical protein
MKKTWKKSFFGTIPKNFRNMGAYPIQNALNKGNKLFQILSLLLLQFVTTKNKG